MEKETIQNLITYGVLLLLILGLLGYGAFKGDLSQLLFYSSNIIEGTGINYELAVDKNTETMWTDSYGKYVYLVFDFGVPVEFSHVEFLAQGTGAKKWYKYDVSTSENNAQYTYVVPPTDTNVISANAWIGNDFIPNKSRYWKFGFRIEGGRYEGGIYELKLSKTQTLKN